MPNLAEDQGPRLSQLTARTWRAVLINAARSFSRDNATDWAAALTYYAVLAIFPAALVVVALVGVVATGDESVDTIMDVARRIAPDSTVDSIEPVIREVVAARSSAGWLLWVGLLGALWSASGYVSAYTRASNAIYHVTEGRRLVKLRPLQLGLTAMSLLLLALAVAMLVLSGPVSRAVADALDLGEAPLTVWSIVKWPLLVAVAALLLSLLAWLGPNVRQPGLRWVAVGGGVTLLLIGIASYGFGLYVANFGSYNRTYGSLGAVIAFLVWLYLVNCAVVFGIETNAALQRGRAMQARDTAYPALDTAVLPAREEREG